MNLFKVFIFRFQKFSIFASTEKQGWIEEFVGLGREVQNERLSGNGGGLTSSGWVSHSERKIYNIDIKFIVFMA